MSIEQLNEIDFIGIDKSSGSVVLTISDHLDWSDPSDHLHKLQEKLNTYIRFCESGELYTSYPAACGRNAIISLASKYTIPPQHRSLLADAKASIEHAGFGFQFE